MNTYIISFSTGTTRYDEQRFTKKIQASSIQAAATRALAIEARPNTKVTGITLDGPVFA